MNRAMRRSSSLLGKPTSHQYYQEIENRLDLLEKRVEYWGERTFRGIQNIHTSMEESLLPQDEGSTMTRIFNHDDGPTPSLGPAFLDKKLRTFSQQQQQPHPAYHEPPQQEQEDPEFPHFSLEEKLENQSPRSPRATTTQLAPIRAAKQRPLPQLHLKESPRSPPEPTDQEQDATETRTVEDGRESKRSRPSGDTQANRDSSVSVWSNSKIEVPPQRKTMMKNKQQERRKGRRLSQDATYIATLRCPFIANLVVHRYFDFFVGIIIMMNTLLIGAQVQYEAATHSEDQFFSVVECSFVAIFTVELLLRLAAFGRDIVAVCGVTWVVLDTLLVFVGLLDLMLTFFEGLETSVTSSSAGRLLKLLRMVRIIRVMRMLRFLAELRVMLSMVAHSLVSLFWLIIFLVALLYIFAIVLTKGASEYLMADLARLSSKTGEDIHEFYGSLFGTMYTLFRSITGGVTWGDSADPLVKVGWFYFFLYLSFICFAVFCVLNLVTGILVDGAIELAKRDRSIMVDKENRAREAVANHLMELLERIDHDGSGTISREEFERAMAQDDVRSFMEALEIDAGEAMGFYDMLDYDGDDSVDVFEWMEGMKKLKGEARSADLQRFRMEVRRILVPMSKAMLGIIEASNVPHSLLTADLHALCALPARGSLMQGCFTASDPPQLPEQSDNARQEASCNTNNIFETGGGGGGAGGTLYGHRLAMGAPPDINRGGAWSDVDSEGRAGSKDRAFIDSQFNMST